MSDTTKPELYYRLPSTTVSITGGREFGVDWETGEEKETARADVAVAVEAEDRDAPIRLPAGEGTHTLNVKLAPDGRLISINGTSHGLLADILAAGLGLGSYAAGLIGSIVAPRLPGLPTPTPSSAGTEAPLRTKAPDETPAKRWQRENPDGDAARLLKARETLAQLHSAMIDRAAEMATTSRPAAGARSLMGVRTAIAAVEDEIAAMTARRDAWFNANYRTVQPLEFSFATDEAFRLKANEGGPPATLRPNQLERGSREARAALAQLKVAVVDVDLGFGDRPPIDDDLDRTQLLSDANRGELPPTVHFVVPRLATIALYREPEDEQADLELERVERRWVVDRRCRLASLPLRGDNNFASSATFSAEGFLESASIDAQGSADVVAQALKGAPEALSQGLAQAKASRESWDTLRASRANRELKALETEKQALEAEIAKRGLEADAAQHETLQALKDRAERLKLEKELNPSAPSAQALADAADIATAARLRVKVQIARREQQLAAMKDDN